MCPWEKPRISGSRGDQKGRGQQRLGGLSTAESGKTVLHLKQKMLLEEFEVVFPCRDIIRKASIALLLPCSTLLMKKEVKGGSYIANFWIWVLKMEHNSGPRRSCNFFAEKRFPFPLGRGGQDSIQGEG